MSLLGTSFPPIVIFLHLRCQQPFRLFVGDSFQLLQETSHFLILGFRDGALTNFFCQTGHSGGFQETMQRELHAERTTNTRNDLRGQQRVPA